MKTCAVIPAYNEESTIAGVVKETRDYVGEVFVIDDGSTDNTAEAARKTGAKVLRHSINRGIGAAQRTGYKIAIRECYEYVVQIDGDAQHSPWYIPFLLEHAEKKDLDMVIASRFLNSSYKSFSLPRRVGITFFSFLVSSSGRTRVKDVTSGFRVYRTDALRRLGELPDTNWAVSQTLEAASKGLKIGEVSVDMPVRKDGESQFNIRTWIKYPFRVIENLLQVIIFRRG